MPVRSRRKKISVFIKRLCGRQFAVIACLVVLLSGSISYAIYMQSQSRAVDPVSYQPLLQLIAEAESSDNYNAHFGNTDSTNPLFTDMSIAQVITWQSEYIARGNPSNAVGRYQIISPTLIDLVQQLQIDTNEKFDQAMQDRMAVALLDRRGGVHYVNNRLSRTQFAASLSQEWAALPKTIGANPEVSYYAGDGLNASRVSIDSLLGAIAPVKSK